MRIDIQMNRYGSSFAEAHNDAQRRRLDAALYALFHPG